MLLYFFIDLSFETQECSIKPALATYPDGDVRETCESSVTCGSPYQAMWFKLTPVRCVRDEIEHAEQAANGAEQNAARYDPATGIKDRKYSV